MEAAKTAVSTFLKRDGKHKTVVDERVNPAVTSEIIKPHHHEEITTAIDKEVHQHHYHITVQPISQRETLPEKHTHNLAPQVDKTFHHGDPEEDRKRVANELGQFKNMTTIRETTRSTTHAPAVVGEHITHHVHETVQPVIHKETVQPEIIHTTIPVREMHTAPSEHHGLSMLPMRTMEEFKKMGGKLAGSVEKHTEYEGHPHSYNPKFQQDRSPADINPEAHIGRHDPESTGHFDQLKHATPDHPGNRHPPQDEASPESHSRSAAVDSAITSVPTRAVATDGHKFDQTASHVAEGSTLAGENAEERANEGQDPKRDSGIGEEVGRQTAASGKVA